MATAATNKKPAQRKKVSGDRPEGADRATLYPDLEMICCIGDGTQQVKLKVAPAINAEKMKEVLGWESEAEYLVRRQQADPTLKAEQCQFPEVGEQLKCTEEDGAERAATVLCKDEHGQKIVCWNVTGNRHFDERTCKQYIQDTLNRQWTGPTTGDGTFNGETFVVGTSGRVESGQHRGVALVRAWQRWKKHAEMKVGRWLELWPIDQYPKGPVMDMPIWRGISESPRVIRTIDIGRRRTTSDTIETSPVFAHLTPQARRECSKSMDFAVDFLWARTGAAKLSSYHECATPSELMDFMDRHPRLQKAVLHLHKCNRERVISLMKLSPGECAAIMYLMAAGNSDINAYRNAEPMPKESALTMDLWDDAARFWTELATGEGPAEVVRNAITEVMDVDNFAIKSGKLAILSKAWTAFIDKDKAEIAPSDVMLGTDEYRTDEHGKRSLAVAYTFNASNGIDLGPKVKKSDNPNPSDVEAEKAKADAEREEARKAKVAEKLKLVEESKKGKKNGSGKKGIMDADLSKSDDKLAKARAALQAKKEREALDRKPAQLEIPREDLAELANGEEAEQEEPEEVEAFDE